VIAFTNTTGTHKGPLVLVSCVKPTDKVLSFHASDIYRIENGKIAEHQYVIETIGIIQKIGTAEFLNPSPSQ
jgi:hypothetical protein